MLESFESHVHCAVLAGEPPDPKSGKSVSLRHHVEGHGTLIDIDRLGQPESLIAFDQAVDLVAEEPDAAAAADLDDRVEGGLGNFLSGGRVGKVDRGPLRLGAA